jgi:hypothetical protein
MGLSILPLAYSEKPFWRFALVVSIVNITPPRVRRQAALGTMDDNGCGGYGSSTLVGAQEGRRFDLCCQCWENPSRQKAIDRLALTSSSLSWLATALGSMDDMPSDGNGSNWALFFRRPSWIIAVPRRSLFGLDGLVERRPQRSSHRRRPIRHVYGSFCGRSAVPAVLKLGSGSSSSAY